MFNAGFIPLTSKTIVVPSRLAEEIKRVQLAGYAVDDGEFFEGVRVVSVPRRDRERPCDPFNPGRGPPMIEMSPLRRHVI